MFTLTENQKSAIEYNGNLVITACPGSGKTTVISEKIKNELSEIKKYQGIIAITFTRKASKELAARCLHGNREAKSSFFGTIDAFCLSEIIFPFSKFVLGRTSEELLAKFESELSDKEKKILTSIESQVGAINCENFNDYIPALKELYSLGCIYFPSIPLLAAYIIQTSKSCISYLKAKYVTTYIDEYQDSSLAQHNLFLALLAIGIRGVCVGDTQQSIYGWRESSPEYLLQLITLSTFKHITISTNHRCHPAIANYANRLFDDKSSIQPTSENRVFHCRLEGSELDAALKINELIPKLIKKFPVKHRSDIAVLARYNKGLQRLREKLTIPNKVYIEDDLSVIESKNSKLWIALLEYRYSNRVLTDEIINNHSLSGEIKREKLKLLRDTIKSIRTASTESLMSIFISTSKLLLDITGSQTEKNALDRIINNSELLEQYTPISNDQIQCMTIHKSKGLEFDIVIHLDLVDWVFPRRVPGDNFSQKIYPDIEQDLNLHYVAITRAKNACLLLHTTQRLNAKDEIKNAEPSCFLSILGTKGLFKDVKIR